MKNIDRLEEMAGMIWKTGGTGMAEEQKGLSEPQPEYGEKELFSLITRLGEMIIKNGGEIFRAD